MTAHVLVARLDSLGDVLLAGPAVRAVANGRLQDGSRPNHVVMLCGRQGEAAASMLPGVAEVYSWDSPWIMNPAPKMTVPHADRLIEYVRNSRINEAVILTSFHQSPLPLALLLRLAGVERISGVSTDYAGSLLDVRLRPGEDLTEDQPEAERALGIARAAGFPLPLGDDGKLKVKPGPPVKDLVGDEPYVVVHPGAAVPARAWPPLHHAAAVELLAGAGYRVVVTGGPDETSLTATVAGPSALDLGGRTDLRTLAGVPAVRWAPYGVPLELLGDQNAACRLTRARICPVPGHPCLDSVSPEDVMHAVERLIGGVSSFSTHLSTRRKDRSR
jgi:ADP-heptose:LPS heptosyltransferase